MGTRTPHLSTSAGRHQRRSSRRDYFCASGTWAVDDDSRCRGPLRQALDPATRCHIPVSFVAAEVYSGPMTTTNEELIAWSGGGFPPVVEAIRRRIDQLPRWQTIGVLQGWWPILARLDERLRVTEPNYRLTKVKQEFGSLDAHMQGHVTSAECRATPHPVSESQVACVACRRPRADWRSRHGRIGVV